MDYSRFCGHPSARPGSHAWLATAPGAAPVRVLGGEIEAVAANLSPRYRPMVILAGSTEVRPAEWLALEWRDIDPEGRVVYATARSRRVG
jgi:integrase